MAENLMLQNLMKGKKGLIMGVANDKSIAYGIAKAASEAGAELAFSYQGELLEKRVRPLAESLGVKHMIPCDVGEDSSIESAFALLQKEWGKLDFVVHAIAFADKDELRGAYYDTSRDNFKLSMDISCYSFTAVSRYARPLMIENGGSLLTLSYFGAEKVIPHYNVMGVAKAALEASVRYLAADLGKDNIRVNAISAGPIRTLAASGIGDFRNMLRWNALNAPLRDNVTIDDVGLAALGLISDLGCGITGEIQHVDKGYNINGMMALDDIDAAIDVLQAMKK